MGVVARRIKASPVRTGLEVWDFITQLISQNDSPARELLSKVSGIIASVIADECLENTPITLITEGPRLRVYCLYGEDAIVGNNENESPLSWNPTGGKWGMYIPVFKDDLEWINNELGKITNQIEAYDLEVTDINFQHDGSINDPDLSLDEGTFQKP